MGDLSEHFSHRDFACRCGQCKGEYRVHLGLVGAIEAIRNHFRKRIKIVSGFWCDDFHEKHGGTKRSFHARGKAAHIVVEETSPQEVFKFAETLTELTGIGLYPKEEFIHIDTRPGERTEWVKEGDVYLDLTPDRHRRFGLE